MTEFKRLLSMVEMTTCDKCNRVVFPRTLTKIHIEYAVGHSGPSEEHICVDCYQAMRDHMNVLVDAAMRDLVTRDQVTRDQMEVLR